VIEDRNGLRSVRTTILGLAVHQGQKENVRADLQDLPDGILAA
jgi:hypothetical protein